ncbi:MAG: LacI family transcriptional regulator [Clostridiales bacterium]|jgi:LacI family transcriptional regulator|nr:LacI family transcriptional regulator [Clostridiales bacterium]
MTTRQDVAKAAGVSPQTVTRVVLNKGYVSTETKSKVEKAINKLGYIPNKVAANLVGQKSRSIAVILRELTNPYYIHLVEAMIERAQKYGCVVVLFRTDEAHLEDVLREIISQRVMGVVNMMFTGLAEESLKQLAEYGIEGVFTGKETGFKFFIDYSEAMKTAMQSLKQSGIKKPAFISGLKPELFEGDPRVKLFQEYYKMLWGGDLPIILRGNYPEQESFVVGRSLTEALLDTHPQTDAIFCLNDMMAFGTMKAIIRSGKRVPEDISVVGFDNILMSDYFNPSLSTISVDIKKEAEYYVDYLAGTLGDGAHVIKAQYIERKSTI